MSCNVNDRNFSLVSSDNDTQNETKRCQKCLDDSSCLECSDTRKLSLKSLGLSKLPKNAVNINNLVSIILEENLFCELPSELCSLQSVKVLNIAKNKIKTLPNEIGNLINLEYVNVSENHLETLPNSLSMASKLLVLNASKNNISKIPDEYKNLKKLEKVNFAYNKLTEVPIALIFGSNFISQLDLSHNNLRDFSKEPKCSASLKVLKVNNNYISELPIWMRCLQTIEELHLGNNHFTSGSRQPLDNMMPLNSITLTKFSITSCGLTHLPVCLKNMKNVMYLDVGNEACQSHMLDNPSLNTIWDATPLLNLCCLRELRLSCVSLPVLPDSFWQILKCLEVLDLRGNSLTWLPEGISNLSHLILFILSNNRLALLPADIGDVKSLKELNLDGNKLHELPDSFGGLEHLTYLDLYDNELSEFPLSVCKLHCLKYLDMELNYFNINQTSHWIPEEFPASYCTMKDSLRSFHLTKQERINGIKEPPSCSVSDDNSVAQKSRSPSPENFEFQPDLQDSFYNCSIAEDEDWDKSDGSDNFFDPSYSQALKDSAARSQCHWARNNGHWEPPVSGDVFCPADIHPNSIPRTSNNKESNVNDGQFDDADDITNE